MPRRIFPASTVTNTTGAALRLTFHVDSTTNRRETDLWTIDGSNNLLERIPNGIILTDAVGAYGAFAGPDDVGTLYCVKHDSRTRTTLTSSGSIAGAATDLAADLADGSITSAKILDGTIATGDLADGAVTTAKIADGTIAVADMSAAALASRNLHLAANFQ